MKLQFIDYGHNSDLPAHVREAIPDEHMQSIFRTVLNSHLRDGKSEMHAYLKSYRALQDMGFERTDGKWGVKKDSPTVSDVHIDVPLGSKKKKPEEKDDPGTVDLREADEEKVKKIIREESGKWHVYSEDGSKHLGGPYETKAEAVERLRQVEGHKSKVAKRISGSSDISLNSKGKALADKLGQRLRDKGGLDILYSSPLPRATETADAIANASNKELKRADPVAALQPWHLGDIEGQEPAEVKDLLKHYIEHPDEVPPGKGADGEKAESFNAAKKRQLDFLSGVYKDFDNDPTMKLGVVMHSRGMQLLQSWVDAGCPEDYDLDFEDLLQPDDPDHADALRWYKEKIKEVDLDSDDPLKPGVYPILHSLTDDDGDSGNPDLEKQEPVKTTKYLPPVEVFKAAKSAYDQGTAVLDITSALAEGQGLGEAEIRKIAEHFADSSAATEPELTHDAWGGKYAQKWAQRVIRKLEKGEQNDVGNSDLHSGVPPAGGPGVLGSQPVADTGTNPQSGVRGSGGSSDSADCVLPAAAGGGLAAQVEKQNGDGVMLAFWPPEDVAQKLAAADGEPANELHVTLAYFGKLGDIGTEALPALEQAVRYFASTHAPVQATLGGLGRFPATPQSDARDVVYLGVHADGIQKFRQDLVDCCATAGLAPKNDFGYNPHMTLVYVNPHAPHLLKTPESLPVTFDKVTLSIGSAKQEFPLTGQPIETTKRDFEIEGTIIKVDVAKHLVFGWFSIVEVDGRQVADTQDDIIQEATLEDTAYDFVLNARVGGEMHQHNGNDEVRGVGRLVESVVFTKEKQQAMLLSLREQGIQADLDLHCVAWWGGMKVEEASTWENVTTGKLLAWSIGGRGKRAAIS